MDTAYFAAPFPVRATPRTRTFTTSTSTAATTAPTDDCCTRWPARPTPHPSTGRRIPDATGPLVADLLDRPSVKRHAEPLDLSSSQPARRDARRADQDRTLTAMLELEVALESAAPGREPAWRAGVLAAVAVLDEATNDEYTNANNPDSLLSDIKRTQPRLRTRVRGLRTQYEQLRQAIVSIRSELADPDEEERRLRRHPSTPVVDTHCAAASARPRIRPHLRGLLRRVPR